nr:aphrodisin-like [Peromyscus maniculatus bairdii]
MLVQLSGEFRTLYLAAGDVKLIGENGPLRIYVRYVLYYNNYKEMRITFYLRQKDGCRLYAVLAKKLVSATFIALSDPTATWTRSQGGDPYITGLWMFENTFSTLPETWVHVQGDGTKESGVFSFLLYFVSSTHFIMYMKFVEKNGNVRNLSAVFSKETSLSKELWDFYVTVTDQLGIPVGNIQDILRYDTCLQ